MMLRRALLAMIVLMLCGCAAGPAIFRPSTGTVAGHVAIRACGGAYRMDQMGCRVNPAAAARLTFVPSDGSPSATGTTDLSGAYRVALKPGTYSVTASQTGFQTLTKSDIVVTSNQTVRADFTLVVGQVTICWISNDPAPTNDAIPDCPERCSSAAPVFLDIYIPEGALCALAGIGLRRRLSPRNSMLDIEECERARVRRDRRFDGERPGDARDLGVDLRTIDEHLLGGRVVGGVPEVGHVLNK